MLAVTCGQKQQNDSTIAAVKFQNTATTLTMMTAATDFIGFSHDSYHTKYSNSETLCLSLAFGSGSHSGETEAVSLVGYETFLFPFEVKGITMEKQ